MPLPVPKANEKRTSFIGRCLKDKNMAAENPEFPARMKACSVIYAKAQDGDEDPAGNEAAAAAAAKEAKKAPKKKVGKAAVPFQSTPASESKVWNVTRALTGLAAWAGEAGKLDLSVAGQRGKYRQGFAFVRDAGENLGDYMLPHHEIVKGELRVNRAAISAAVGAINGARGGVSLGDKERAAAFNHLLRHCKEDFNMPADDLPDYRKRMEYTHKFCKAEETADFTFILGPVLVPESLDKQGDIISESEIEQTAHDYMEDSQRPGLMHQLMLGSRDAQVVESYILRAAIKLGERELAAGTWMLAMRVYNDKLRKMIREGKIKGYSIGGHGSVEEEPAP